MIIMTELDNACLYLYSMTSKGLNIKKELVKFVGKTFNLRSRNENDRNKEKRKRFGAIFVNIVR